MNTLIKFLTVGFIFYFVVGCRFNEKVNPNYAPTKFKISVFDENNKPIKDKTISLHASWKISFYQGLVDSILLKTDNTGAAEGELKIKGQSFILTISTDIINDETKFKVLPLNQVFNYKLQLKNDKIKIGELNELELVMQKE